MNSFVIGGWDKLKLDKVEFIGLLSALMIFEIIILISDILSINKLKIYTTGSEVGDLIFFIIIFSILILFSFGIDLKNSIFTYILTLFSVASYFTWRSFPYFLVPSMIGSIWMIYIFLIDSESIFKVETSFLVARIERYFLGFFILIEFSSLVRWLTIPLFHSSFYSDFTWIPSKIDRGISLFLQRSIYINPILYVSSAYFWIVFFISRLYEYKFGEDSGGFLEVWTVLRKRLRDSFGDLKDVSPLSDKPNLMFLFALVLSLLPFIYLYNPSLNPGGGFVGVDMPHYNVAFKELVKVKGFGEAAWLCLTSVMGGQRPLYFFLLYMLYKSFNFSMVDVIRLEPVVMTLFMTIAVYFLILEWMGSRRIAAFVSLFSPLGVLTVGGVYGGFYANWFAWILITFSLGFLARYFRTRNLLSLIISVLFSVLALFTHPWFWDVYIATIFLYFISLLVEARTPRKMVQWKNIGIAFFLLVSGIADFLKEWIYRMFGAYGAATQVYRMNWIGLIWIPDFWGNLRSAFLFYLAGAYSNWLLLTLSIIGVASLFVVDDDISRIFSIWIVILSLFLPFVYLEPFCRIFLLFPFHITYPIGLAYILNSKNENHTNSLLIFTLVFLLEINYMFRSIPLILKYT